MAVSSVFILACLLIGTYAQEGNYEIGLATKEGIKILGESIVLGSDVAQDAVKGATTVSKQVIDEIQRLSKKIIEGGTNIGNKGLDLVDKTGGNMPLVRYPVKGATALARWILELSKNLGTKGIDAGAGIGGNTADYIEKITTLTTNSIKDFTNTGTKLTTDNIDQSLNILKNLIRPSSTSLTPGSGTPTVTDPATSPVNGQ